MAAELLQASGGRVEQMEQQTMKISPSSSSFSSSSSTFTSSSSSSSPSSSSSSSKLRKVSQAEPLLGVQCTTSAVLDSFSQVPTSPPIPEGESLPQVEDPLRPITAHQGEDVAFRARVTGRPRPTVRWERASGSRLSDLTKSFCDNGNNQHELKIKTLALEDTDVYKCTASNKHGAASHSASLVVTENPALDFKKMLKKCREKKREEKKPPTEEEMLKILAGADKKDYERICAENGFTDFRGILKKLREMKRKVEMVRVLKPLEDITTKPDSNVVFDTILELKDPNIKMLWFLDSEPLRIQYSHGKYEVKQKGTKYMLCISRVSLADMGTYSLQVADKRLSGRLNVIDEPLKFLSDFKPKKVRERQTAVFEVRLSKKTDAPLIWTVKGKEVERGEKFEVSLSEDGLTYTLKIKDIKMSDTGDYNISLGDLRATLPLFIQRIPIHFTKQLKNLRVKERAEAHLECEVSSEDVRVRWVKDGSDITENQRYIFLQEGKRAEAVIEDCEMTDGGEYSVICTQDDDPHEYVTSADLTVEERFASVKSALSDARCPSGSSVELCVVLDDEKVDGVWSKDGVEISKLRGVQVVKQGAFHKLHFSFVTHDHEGKYTFRAKGAESEAVLTIAEPPGAASQPRVSKVTKGTVTVSWTPPAEDGGAPLLGYILEKRKKGSNMWLQVNEEVLTDTQFLVEQLVDEVEYEFRVISVNRAGAGRPSAHSHAVLAKDLTHFPLPPDNLRLEEGVPGSVTLRWDHSLDLSDEYDGAHYVILKRDSSATSWFTVAERVFGSRYTVTGLLPGRKYYFRVIAQNSMGDSDPLDSKEPVVITKEKECISSLRSREYTSRTNQVKPTFLLPLKNHAVRRGHDCTMSCAYQGSPTPQACWYKGDLKVSESPRLWHSSANGVCTLVIPTCGAKDGGEYTLRLENCLGTAECSSNLVIFDLDDKGLLESLTNRQT